MQLIDKANLLLEQLTSTIDPSTDNDHQAVQQCKATWDALKELFTEQGDIDMKEEILFFKVIKAEAGGLLLYYQSRLDVRHSIPPENPVIKEHILRKELKQVRKFFAHHAKLYAYYRNKDSYLDHFLFLRSTSHNSVYATIGDRLFSRFRAAEALGTWLCGQLGAPAVPAGAGALRWTAPKAALAELIYALQTCGVFNQTQADIATITKYITQVFEVPIGNIYKVYEEIRLRKKNRTPFLDSLKQQMEQRMNRDDEQAL